MQLVRLHQRIQEAVDEVFSLRQDEIQQLLSSACRLVSVQLLNFFELFLVQRTLLVHVIRCCSGIQCLRNLVINVPNLF